jgi:hypothetical protein
MKALKTKKILTSVSLALVSLPFFAQNTFPTAAGTNVGIGTTTTTNTSAIEIVRTASTVAKPLFLATKTDAASVTTNYDLFKISRSLTGSPFVSNLSFNTNPTSALVLSYQKSKQCIGCFEL